LHQRIDVVQPIARRVEFRAADVRGAVKQLTLKIRDIDDVEVHEADRADAGGGKIERRRRAEAAGTDDEDAGGFEPPLSGETDVRE
jgi:hypothetical protein